MILQDQGNKNSWMICMKYRFYISKWKKSLTYLLGSSYVNHNVEWLSWK